MTIDTVRELLGWCTVINLALLLTWFISFTFAREWILGLHRKWFKLADEHFDTVHYAGMVFFKLCVLLFNLVPYVALRLIN